MRPVQSQLISQKLALEIIQKFWSVANFRNLLKMHFTQYCYEQSVKYVEESLNEQIRSPQKRDSCPQEKQPSPLYKDNFFPAAASIDDQQTKNDKLKGSVASHKKNSFRLPTQRSLSQVSIASKKLGAKNHPNPYQKLDLPQQQPEESLYTQLRKAQEQKRSKQEAQVLTKRKVEAKPKKNGKDEKISYGYDGQIMKMKNQSRNSLISGGLQGQTSATIQKSKEANKNIPPTKIQYDRKLPLKTLGKLNEIQFTDIKTLFSQASVKRGIKLKEGGVTIQQKQKKTSIKELKQSLSGRRLSKDDYKRIRDSTGNIAPFDDLSRSKLGISLESSSKLASQQTQMLQKSHLRSASESKLGESRSLRRKSVVTVSDPQLLDQLLNGPVNQAQERSITKIQQGVNKQEINTLDSVDNYNLLYIKKGASLNTKNKSKSVADLAQIKLPRIHGPTHHISLGSYQTIERPRVRQKVKDQSHILMNIRRKFDEKLRL